MLGRLIHISPNSPLDTGDAMGEACWLKGHAPLAFRRKAPLEGFIRVDLSIAELLQLGWLAHLGFQCMMPNFRDFEIHRLSGAEDALEGARAVSKIERSCSGAAKAVRRSNDPTEPSTGADL